MLILLLALSLAMDAFAVSVSNGLCFSNMSKRFQLLSSLSFGVFQALMPLIGYLCGLTFSSFTGVFAPFFAFLLLVCIGANMISEGVHELRYPDRRCIKQYSFKVMLLQALATSIDALAAGVSLAMLGSNIFLAALCIGGITFLLCLFGVSCSRRLGVRLKEKSVILGGVILCLLGAKALLEGIF